MNSLADTIIKTFTFKLRKNRAFEAAAEIAREDSRSIYNWTIARRREAHAAGMPIGRCEQSRELTALRAERPETRSCLRTIQSDAIDRGDLAYRAAFRRVREGKKPGFPRFRPKSRYKTFSQSIEPQRACPLHGDVLTVPGVGTVRVRLHRTIEGTVKQLRITQKADGWYTSLVCEMPKPEPLPKTGLDVGVDVGLTVFAALSNGETVANPRHLRGKERALKRSQQALARKKRGSANRGKQRRKVALLHLHVADARKDFHHKVSTGLVERFDKIVVEDLQVRNMVQNHCLAKSISDAGWNAFTLFLAYKAANAGREFVRVHPAYTSQECSRCGARQQIPKGPHMYVCPCGLVLDRDWNAAQNILLRASGPESKPASAVVVSRASRNGVESGAVTTTAPILRA